MAINDQVIVPGQVKGAFTSGASGGGASPPFAISDTTGLQAALDSKLEDFSTLGATDITTSGGALSADVLHLSGGAMSGGITLSGTNKITNASFVTDTSDGTDNAYNGIVGGGSESVNRGGAVYVYGNEYSGFGGFVDIQAGNVAGSTVRLRVGGANRMLIDSAGIKPQGTGGSGHFLKQTTPNGVITSAALAASDMPAILTTEAAKDAQGPLTASGLRLLTWSTASKNTLGLSYSGGVWTATVAGRHHISAFVKFTGSAYATLYIYKNGGLAKYGTQGNPSTGAKVTDYLNLSLGETVAIYAYLSADDSADTSGYLTIDRVGAAA